MLSECFIPILHYFEAVVVGTTRTTIASVLLSLRGWLPAKTVFSPPPFFFFSLLFILLPSLNRTLDVFIDGSEVVFILNHEVVLLIRACLVYD